MPEYGGVTYRLVRDHLGSVLRRAGATDEPDAGDADHDAWAKAEAANRVKPTRAAARARGDVDVDMSRGI